MSFTLVATLMVPLLTAQSDAAVPLAEPLRSEQASRRFEPVTLGLQIGVGALSNLGFLALGPPLVRHCPDGLSCAVGISAVGAGVMLGGPLLNALLVAPARGLSPASELQFYGPGLANLYGGLLGAMATHLVLTGSVLPDPARPTSEGEWTAVAVAGALTGAVASALVFHLLVE